MLEKPRHWVIQRNPEISMQRPSASLDVTMGDGLFPGGREPYANLHRLFGLTPREIEVVGWVARGMTSKSIAS